MELFISCPGHPFLSARSPQNLEGSKELSLQTTGPDFCCFKLCHLHQLWLMCLFTWRMLTPGDARKLSSAITYHNTLCAQPVLSYGLKHDACCLFTLSDVSQLLCGGGRRKVIIGREECDPERIYCSLPSPGQPR